MTLKKLLTLLLLFLTLSPLFADNKKVIYLNEENTIVLFEAVSAESVKEVNKNIRLLDNLLPKGEPLYLILNTPGGSVIDGMDIVNLAQSLSRPVHTITIFAASMGFVLAQHLNLRYILQNGILMSHRMKTAMSQAEVGGELDEALSFSHIINKTINNVCANRMSMNLEDYERRIADEWWLYGQNAVDKKAADEVITVSCTEKLVALGKCPF